MNETLVSIAELAAELGVTPESAVEWLDRTGASAERDWAGRLGCTPADARKTLDAVQAARSEHARKEAAYQSYLVERERERQAAAEAAEEGARKRLAERQAREMTAEALGYASYNIASPMALSAAYQREASIARHRALVEFDRKRPVKDFSEFKG